MIIDLKRCIDRRWLFKSGATFILGFSCCNHCQCLEGRDKCLLNAGVSLTRQSVQENLRGGRGCRAVACFSRRPLQAMWRQRRFCGRHFVHKKRLLKYFQRSVRWVNCKLAMAVLTKRNIQEFKDKGFTQASYCILSSGQFGKYGYRSKTFRLIQFCKIEARNNRGYGITNSYPKKWWSFLDALASLDFKLSVGQSVTYRFSDSKASASVGRLSIYFHCLNSCWFPPPFVLNIYVVCF